MSGGESALATRRRILSTIAIVGVIGYTVVDVVLQLLPPHYSAITDAESDLAVGPFGWIMAINFFGRGVTSAATIGLVVVTGPRTRLRSVGVALFAVAGFCSALIAFFPTDIPAISGQRIEPTTLHGVIHLVGASTGFVFALAGFWVLTFWMRGRAGNGLGTASGAWPTLFLAVASAGLAFLAITIVATPALLGLAERVCLAGILGWVLAAVVKLRARPFRSASD